MEEHESETGALGSVVEATATLAGISMAAYGILKEVPSLMAGAAVDPIGIIGTVVVLSLVGCGVSTSSLFLRLSRRREAGVATSFAFLFLAVMVMAIGYLLIAFDIQISVRPR